MYIYTCTIYLSVFLRKISLGDWFLNNNFDHASTCICTYNYTCIYSVHVYNYFKPIEALDKDVIVFLSH